MPLVYRLALVISLLVSGFPTVTYCQVFYNITPNAAIARQAGPQPVYIERVVDTRASKNNLGWLTKGLEDTRLLARFRQGLEPELTAFCQQHLQRTPDARPVVLVIRRLTLTEQVHALQEVAVAELVADVYALQPDGYHLLHHATELVSTAAPDATCRHASNLSTLLLQALAPLRHAAWDTQLAASPGLTWSAVLGHSSTPASYPILQAASWRIGGYQNVKEFQQNAPSNQTEWRIKPQLASVGFLAFQIEQRDDTPDSRWHPAQDWGFFDGEQLYIRHGGMYFPVKRKADTFYYLAPVSVDPRQRTYAGLPTPVGTATRSSPSTAVAILQLQLDTGFAGEETPISNRSDTPTATPQLVIYRRPDAAPDKPVQVRINGQVAGTLRGGEFLTLATSATVEISICGQTEKESCFTFRPDLLAANYLDCRLAVATQSAPSLRLVSADAGAAVVRDLTLVH